MDIYPYLSAASDWYYVIGTSPRSARSKLRFLSFCDQNPWKDVKSSIVFFEFVSIDDSTFRQKQKKIRVTGTLIVSFNVKRFADQIVCQSLACPRRSQQLFLFGT